MIELSEMLNANILIVDDEDMSVKLLENVLRNVGYQQITSTTDPFAVRSLYKAHYYDLILLDLEMPRLNGFLVMDQLKEIELTAYLPVLAVTADSSHRLHALQAGA